MLTIKDLKKIDNLIEFKINTLAVTKVEFNEFKTEMYEMKDEVMIIKDMIVGMYKHVTEDSKLQDVYIERHSERLDLLEERVDRIEGKKN